MILISWVLGFNYTIRGGDKGATFYRGCRLLEWPLEGTFYRAPFSEAEAGGRFLTRSRRKSTLNVISVKRWQLGIVSIRCRSSRFFPVAPPSASRESLYLEETCPGPLIRASTVPRRPAFCGSSKLSVRDIQGAIQSRLRLRERWTVAVVIAWALRLLRAKQGNQSKVFTRHWIHPT